MVENKVEIDKKINELVALLAKSEVDNETARSIRIRLNAALKYSEPQNAPVKTSGDDFSIMLPNNQFDGKPLKKDVRMDRLSKIVLAVIGVVMIALGLGMIIMPAPHSFEMYTIFYFTRDDGITIMDLISLLVVLAGAYFFIRGILPKRFA